MGSDKKSKKKNKHSHSNSHGGGPDVKLITDSRFASVQSDPRFKRAPKHKTKVEIDSRFNRMFTDKRFAPSSAPVDKRGKPKKQNSDNFLKSYYRVEEKKEEEEEEEERKGEAVVKLGGDESETEQSGESDASESEEEDDDDVVSWESDASIDTDDDDDEELNVEYEPEEPSARYYFAVVECDSVATADYLYKACDGVEFERSSNVLDLRFIPDSMEFKHPPRDVATEVPANYEGLNFQTKALQLSNINLSWDEDEPDRVKTLKRKFDADQLAELELKEFLASDDSESDEEGEDEEGEGKSDKKQKKRDMYRALLGSGNGSDGDEEEDDDDQDMELTFNTGLEDISKRMMEKKDKKQETVWETKLREQREKKKLRKHRSKNSSEDEGSDTDQEAINEPGDFFEDDSDEEEPKKSNKGKSKKRNKQEEDTSGQAEATKNELELLLADDDTMAAGTGAKGYNLKRRKGKDGKKIKLTLEDDKIPQIVEDPRFSSLFSSPAFALDPTDPRFERSSSTYARLVSQQKEKAREVEQLALVEPQAVTDEQLKSDAVGSSKKEKDELSVLVKMVKTKSKQIKLPSNEKSGKKEKKEKDTPVASVNRKTKALKKSK
ncbi:hypothetical protein G4B88_006928 [Cannabis sativa]|uniref:NUC153 domain-containing protein n=1 Tax=Cannabis sativa TaxID=3483 RepID=A0A7J6G459_CANSA|nr:hypothetical protein G4B88_006928 [Cannabis sativa]